MTFSTGCYPPGRDGLESRQTGLLYVDFHDAFFEELYAIYGEGVRCQKDQRLSARRSERGVRLQDRIRRLCTRTDRIVWKEMPDDQRRFLKLQNELLSCLDNLFVFVEHPEVESPAYWYASTRQTTLLGGLRCRLPKRKMDNYGLGARDWF